MLEVKSSMKKFSNTLNFLYQKNFFDSKIKFDTKIAKIVIPEKFSLTDNPDKVFSILKKITGYIKLSSIEEIEFDYSKVIHLDLGAILLKNVICLNALKKGITFSGNFPGKNDLDENGKIKEKYKEAIEIFMFSGLFKSFDLNPDDYCNFSGEPLTLPFKGAGKNPVGIKCKTIKLGKIENDITEYFNKALRAAANRELNEDGERFFDKIIGEVIANCQEHTGEFNQYFCLGHYTGINEELGRYQLSIFNFGQTIAEGIKNSKTLPEEVQNRMAELVKIHSRKKYLVGPSEWDEESLTTLYSLQNKVSRKFQKGKKRGTGTIRMLQAFQEVGGCSHEKYKPEMTIISGSTQIIVDNSEICKLNKKQISFNKENTLEIRPDKNYVKKIKSFFPGTVISLNIFLDKKWLDNKLK